jgi:hypothetical protein
MITGYDFLGPRPELKVFELSRYKSFIGGILSIIASITISLLFGYFAIQTFSRQNATRVIYNQELEPYPYFNSTKYPFALTLYQRLNGQPFTENPEKTFNMALAYFWMDNKMEAHFAIIKLVLCNQTILGEYGLLYTNPLIPYSYCPDPNDPNFLKIKIFGYFGSLAEGGLVTYYINQCVNNTIPGVICHSQEKINNNLERAYVAISYLNYNIDNNNLTVPGKIYLDSVSKEITNTIFKTFCLRFRQIFHDTDYGFVFQGHTVETFHTVEPIEESVTSIPKFPEMPGNFAEVIIQCSRYKDIYSRSYIKLQDLLANIGGAIKAVMLIAGFLDQILIKNIFLMDISNKLFQIEEHVDESSLNDMRGFINQQTYNQSPSYQIKNNWVNQTSITEKIPHGELCSIQDSQIEANDSKLKKEHFPSFTSIKKKAKISLSMSEILCPQILLKSNPKINSLRVANSRINKKLSIDYIINKFHEIDKIKITLFSQEELSLMKIIPNPSLTITKNKKNSKIQKLWSYLENEDEIVDIEINKLSKSLRQSEYMKKLMNIL